MKDYIFLLYKAETDIRSLIRVNFIKLLIGKIINEINYRFL